MKVVAGVLTYNRKALLLECLAALLTQTVTPRRLLVVDNGSTDGTGEALEAAGYLRNPDLRLLRLSRNIGPAGGFRVLFREAVSDECDWLWVMDDDVIPTPRALEELIRAFRENFSAPAEIGFLISKAIGADGRAVSVPIVDGRSDGVRCPEWACRLEAAMVRVTEAPFCSALLPRQTIQDFGLPLSDFYIWGEDGDYTLRVTRSRPGYLVGRSVVRHLRAVPGDLSVLTEHDPVRLENFFYHQRNRIYLDRTYYPRYVFYLQVLRALMRAARCLFGASDRRLWRAWIVVRGLIAGLFFRPGAQRPPSGAAAPLPTDRKPTV